MKSVLAGSSSQAVCAVGPAEQGSVPAVLRIHCPSYGRHTQGQLSFDGMLAYSTAVLSQSSQRASNVVAKSRYWWACCSGVAKEMYILATKQKERHRIHYLDFGIEILRLKQARKEVSYSRRHSSSSAITSYASLATPGIPSHLSDVGNSETSVCTN